MRNLLLAAVFGALAFGCSRESPTSPTTPFAPRTEQVGAEPFGANTAGLEDIDIEERRAHLLRMLDAMAERQSRALTEDFNCTNVEEVRARFSDPGFIDGLDVGLFVKFIAVPAGAKKIRVWWDYENDFDAYQDIAFGDDDPNPEDSSRFDIETIIEHTYRIEGEKRVRVELILEDSTGNCARNRDIVVTAPVAGGASFDYVATFAGVPVCNSFPSRGMGLAVKFTPAIPPGTTYTVRARIDGTGVVAPVPIFVVFSNAAGDDFVFPPAAFVIPPTDFTGTFNTTATHQQLFIAADIFSFPAIPSMSTRVLSIDIPGKTVGIVGTLAGSCP